MRNILCVVYKENRRTEDLEPKGIVLYSLSCGKINDTVLCGNITHNNRPYFGVNDEKDLEIYAHSDFGYSRGYETEFVEDVFDIEEQSDYVYNFLEEYSTLFEDREEKIMELNNVYVNGRFKDVLERFLEENNLNQELEENTNLGF